MQILHAMHRIELPYVRKDIHVLPSGCGGFRFGHRSRSLKCALGTQELLNEADFRTGRCLGIHSTVLLITVISPQKEKLVLVLLDFI